MNQHSHGQVQRIPKRRHCPSTWSRRSSSLEFIPWTLRQPEDRSPTPQLVQSSQIPSGETISPERQSISMRFSVDNSPRRMTTSESKNLENSSSLMERLNLPKSYETVETGVSPGIEPSELPPLRSCTDCRSSQDMANISRPYSPLLTPASTIVSFPTTKQLGNVSDRSEISNCSITRNLQTSRSLTWIRSGYQPAQKGPLRRTMEKDRSEERAGRGLSPVTGGTKAPASKRKRTVEEIMCVIDVENVGTREATVTRLPVENKPSKCPKYLRKSIWFSADKRILNSPTANCTLFDAPLPRPSQEEFDNVDALTTIRNNPDLFKIVTPINVDSFQQLLESHPNQPFVKSVCVALREGFWPWAHTNLDTYPVTWDFSHRPPKTEHEADFLRSQRDVELVAGRYSEGFGSDLLQGMYSTPIHSAPKPRSEKLRLINDHSAGEYSLNSMIAREDVAGARMDSISDLTTALLCYRRSHPSTTLVMFKSDVSATYRRLPLHALWQIKQIATIDGVRHVDRCTSFGGRGSCRCYTAFMGLVLWIAIFVKSLADLFGYIDDNFLFDVDGNVEWYEPYGSYYPAKQTQLLLLWDEIGLPHEKLKQEYGRTLRIIGFMVDPNSMRVSMDNDDQASLVRRVLEFIATAAGGTRRTLREFQELAGWINWSFKVFPLLKPALSNVYEKISGKSESHAKIFVNKGVVRDLSWFVSKVKELDGIYLLEDVDWATEEAVVTASGDVCLSGLGYFLEDSCKGFQCVLPTDCPTNTIFYFEALVVVSIVEAASQMSKVPSKLLIFSDNENTVDMFYSLRCKPPYNDLLKYTVNLLLRHHISLRVVHIPGVDNIIADSLSRFENARAYAACPGLSISTFQPPQLTMGLEEK